MQAHTHANASAVSVQINRYHTRTNITLNISSTHSCRSFMRERCKCNLPANRKLLCACVHAGVSVYRHTRVHRLDILSCICQTQNICMPAHTHAAVATAQKEHPHTHTHKNSHFNLIQIIGFCASQTYVCVCVCCSLACRK